MANTVTKTTLVDGARNLVVLVNIVGDGSGEETDTILIDRSAFAPTDGIELVVECIEGYCSGVTATIEFDATADGVLCRLPADLFYYDWSRAGGVSSNKLTGAGATGDLLITTSSLGAGDFLTFTIFARKA